MSKFTKEQLITRAKMRLAMVAGFPESTLAQMDKQLAEIALAVMGELHDRNSFERWYSATCGLSGTDLESEFNRDDAGEYIYSGAADAWKAWKASRADIHHYAEKAVKHETD